MREKREEMVGSERDERAEESEGAAATANTNGVTHGKHNLTSQRCV